MLKSEKHIFIVPVVAISELLSHAYRVGKPEAGREIKTLCLVSPFMEIKEIDLTIAEKAAGYKHGLGLSMLDSLILATSVCSNADILVTGDSDYDIAQTQNIINVKEPKDID